MIGDGQDQALYSGRYLQVRSRDGWEYATRPNATGVVAIVALHDDGRVVLIEQTRPAVGGRVVELPAGLAGDGDVGESMLAAAKRELLEETGYEATAWVELFTGLSSAGLTDEAVTYFLATGLNKTGAGGGVDGEAIDVHEVAVDRLIEWIAERARAGVHVDAKLFSGIYAAIEYQRKAGA